MEPTIGKQLKVWRESHGLSQVSLGEKLGVTQAAVSQCECGVRPFTEIAAILLERLSEGTLKAVDFVLDSRKERLTELLSSPADSAPPDPGIEIATIPSTPANSTDEGAA